MATIHRIGKVDIRIYRRGEHPPPHVHVDGSGIRAQVAIADGAVIEGSLPTKTERAVRDWLKDNREETLERWEEITGLKPR